MGGNTRQQDQRPLDIMPGGGGENLHPKPELTVQHQSQSLVCEQHRGSTCSIRIGTQSMTPGSGPVSDVRIGA